MKDKGIQIKKLYREIAYPESDGKPRADNTLQAHWMFLLYNNFKALYHGKDIFVAIDLFWYPVEGNPKIRIAPDVLIVFDRPDEHRGSYKQWEKENIPLTVVFEIITPSVSAMEILEKKAFYEKYGVQEFIIIDPDTNSFIAYNRSDNVLKRVETGKDTWKSPLLNISLLVEDAELKVYDFKGNKFMTFCELLDEINREHEDSNNVGTELASLLEEKERLKARLRELGENP